MVRNGHAEHCPYDNGAHGYTVPGALRFLLSAFLWPGDLIEDSFDRDVLDATASLFYGAWEADEATVLLDALDEAISPALRKRLIIAARALYGSLSYQRIYYKADERSSRIYLTARRQFRSELDLETFLITDVEPLDLGELSQLARSVFDPIGKRQVADRFVAELPYQPAALRLGGTPMTALLLLFYFDASRGWASRYHTYDAVMRFVLLKVWDQAKQQPGLTTLTEFFAAAEGADFSERFPEAGALYDALSWTAYRALFGEDETPLRRLTRRDLLAFFTTWLQENDSRDGLPTPDSGVDGSHAERQASTWFQQLHIAALFIADDAGQFVFIHSTVLEFLAGRYLVDHDALLPEALARDGREALETFPMLCSRDWQKAHRILALLPEHVPDFVADSVLAFSCLAETEDAEARALDAYNAEEFRRPLRERMNASPARDPIDQALSQVLWSESSALLKERTQTYTGLIPLKRDIWPTRYAGGWEQSPELRELREAFLRELLHPALHDRFIDAPVRGLTWPIAQPEPAVTTMLPCRSGWIFPGTISTRTSPTTAELTPLKFWDFWGRQTSEFPTLHQESSRIWVSLFRRTASYWPRGEADGRVLPGI
ncbi:MAG: hypothetical protein R3F19_30020 [Verrucomicrobiales bacterium]